MEEQMKEEVYQQDLYVLGDKIREQRRRQQLSQEQLAEMIGVSGNTISRIETGEAIMKIDKLFRMADMLKVSPDFFLPERFYQRVQTQILDSAAALWKQLSEENQRLVYDTAIPLISGLLERQRHQ